MTPEQLASIKAHRVKTGLSQDKVAKHLGLKSRTGYHNKETGKQAISADQLIKLAELFGCTLDKLLGIEKPQPSYQVCKELQWIPES